MASKPVPTTHLLGDGAKITVALAHLNAEITAKPVSRSISRGKEKKEKETKEKDQNKEKDQHKEH